MRRNGPAIAETVIPVTLAVWLLALGSAWAEEERGEQVKALFAAARASYDAERHAEALESFQNATQLVSRPSLSLWVAHCYRRLHQPRKALLHYRQYLAACDGERRISPRTPEPQSLHACSEDVQAEVKGLVQSQEEVVELLQSGEAALRADKAMEALARFRQAERRSAWTVIGEQMGRAQTRLGYSDEARATFSKTAEGLKHYLSDWKARHPEREPPDAEEIKRDLSRIEGLLRHLTLPPPPREPRFSRGWLAAGIVTTVTTVGFAALAGVSYGRATDCLAAEPCYDSNSTAWGVSFGLALTSAVASGISWYLFHRSQRSPAGTSGAR
jgi:tetratricopeptide (TPR) repeat protein